MKRSYQIAERKSTRKLKKFLLENAEALLPMVELIEASSMAVDELIEVLGRASIEAVLRRCLGTTNLIESPHSGVRMRTRRVSCWQGGRMVLRWVASAFLATEKNFRRIPGYKELRMLKAKFGDRVVLT